VTGDVDFKWREINKPLASNLTKKGDQLHWGKKHFEIKAELLTR